MDFEARVDRRPQGPKKLSRERETYVGINDRTGRRWRNGRQASGKNKAAPPLVETGPWQYTEDPVPVAAAQEPENEAPSRYLNETDRIHIADRFREKASIRTIAAELGRS
uniref:helix-turn-helix domain-containing protein n=1 Tax=Streptomyces sp. NRRL S-15 TaxID=1463886 RepID=UPI001F1A26D2